MGALTSLGAVAVSPGRKLAGLAGYAGRRAQGAVAAPARWVVLSTVEAALSTLDDALGSPLAEEIVERIIASRLAENVREHVIARALDSPDAEPLVTRLIDSHIVEAAMVELVENEGLWVLVEEVARSPAVTQAISQQGLGFANQLAGVMRQRSLSADERLERLARRLARRAPRADAPGSTPGSDEPVRAP